MVGSRSGPTVRGFLSRGTKAVKGPPWLSSSRQPFSETHSQTWLRSKVTGSLWWVVSLISWNSLSFSLQQSFHFEGQQQHLEMFYQCWNLLLKNISTQQFQMLKLAAVLNDHKSKQSLCVYVFFVLILPNKTIAPLRFSLWLPLVSSSIRRSMRLP